jgi:hypothetical protein
MGNDGDGGGESVRFLAGAFFGVDGAAAFLLPRSSRAGDGDGDRAGDRSRDGERAITTHQL